MKPGGRTLLLTLTASLAAAPVAGCGSSGTQAHTGPAHSVVVTDPATVGSIAVAVGDTIDFRVPPPAGEHRSNGQPVTWPAPYTSQPALLRAEAAQDCPADYTCEDFRALVTGSATIYVPSPSGIICGPNHECVGISARAPFPIPVLVRTGGAPVVSYRQ